VATVALGALVLGWRGVVRLIRRSGTRRHR
jgi:hypothetical protein